MKINVCSSLNKTRLFVTFNDDSLNESQARCIILWLAFYAKIKLLMRFQEGLLLRSDRYKPNLMSKWKACTSS